MSDWTHHRAKVAALSRIRPSDDPELTEARQSLKAARLEQHVREQVASFPPLTNAQLDRISALLKPTHSALVGGGAR